jgi:hypothetical protein
MNRRMLVSMLVLFALLGTLLPGKAQAQNPVQADSRVLRTASARFTHSDPESCILTRTWIFANESAYRQGKFHQTSMHVGVAQELLDCEDGSFLANYSGEVFFLPGRIPIQPSLKEASLQVAVPLTTYAGDPVKTVYLDLQWAGVGEVQREHSKYRSDECLQMIHTRLAERQAVAWGSISDGQTDFAQTLEAAQFLETKVQSVMKECD